MHLLLMMYLLFLLLLYLYLLLMMQLFLLLLNLLLLIDHLWVGRENIEKLWSFRGSSLKIRTLSKVIESYLLRLLLRLSLVELEVTHLRVLKVAFRCGKVLLCTHSHVTIKRRIINAIQLIELRTRNEVGRFKIVWN